MSLLSVICTEMGLEIDTSPIDNKKFLPETWTDFIAMNENQFKQYREEILKQLNLDSNTVDQIWFKMHYLSLYNHFNIKDNIPHTMNNNILSAFPILLSRHPTIIKSSTFVIRMEWSDIATALNAKKKKQRPQSPWGVIPSLSIPANPIPFQEYIWPNIPFEFIDISSKIKQYLKNNGDKITVVYLKTLDLAAICVYGLNRKDEQDKWLIRYYQKYGYIILKHKSQLQIQNNIKDEESKSEEQSNTINCKYCNLKTCLSYHRICLLMHLHGKWTENLLMMEKYEEKSDNDIDDVSNEKGIRLQKYVSGYLGEDFDAEVAFNDIYHLQEKHIDFWVTIDDAEVKIRKYNSNYKSTYENDDADEDSKNMMNRQAELEEMMYRYGDIKLFCDDMNETRAEFCGEFICGLMKDSDIEELKNEKTNINNKKKMKHPTLMIENINKNDNSYSDINKLCINLHKNMFHGYSLFDALKQYKLKAVKMDPERIKRKQSAIRLEMQQRMRQKMQQKMRQKSYIK